MERVIGDDRVLCSSVGYDGLFGHLLVVGTVYTTVRYGKCGSCVRRLISKCVIIRPPVTSCLI